ncbi:MAG: class A beta-lactamase [Alphaproteobacteria bacterium]|nr:class A beta-lactamase [Alphaproteobacteria bacterium]
MTSRRQALALIAAGAAAPAWAAPMAADRIRALERASGGRIGVAAIDTGSGWRLVHRADERFPMCSTFKVLGVSAILHGVDTGRETLSRRMRVPGERVGWAPVTGKHVGQEMALGDICAAALQWSDNGAANLILDALGGPPAVTAYARAIGDARSRLDRREPALNEALPGDPRDTTTPNAMAADLRRLLLGPTLSPASRQRLTDWMLGCRTSDDRFRAAVRKTWRVADKTGTGERGAANDVGVIWPPGRAPIVIAAYTVGATTDLSHRNATLAEIARIVVSALP